MTAYTPDQFRIPPQPEIIPELSSTPDITAEDALRAALAAAPETATINPFAVDKSRVEFGAATLQSAVYDTAASTPEVRTFNPESTADLLVAGRYIIAMRDAAKAA